eukprot:1157780-Pyramimonas_sp.AAC.1
MRKSLNKDRVEVLIFSWGAAAESNTFGAKWLKGAGVADGAISKWHGAGASRPPVEALAPCSASDSIKS